MAAKLIESISEVLECGICLGQLENATHLSCLHTFCRKCIIEFERESLASDNDVKCPVCRARQNFGTFVRPNLLANKILRIVADMEEASKGRAVCEAHPDLERSHFCEKCELVVCAECALLNHKHSGHLSHLKSLDEVASRKTNEIISFLRDASEWTDTHKKYATCIDGRKNEGNGYLDSLVAKIETACQNQLDLIRNRLITTAGNLVGDIETRRSAFNAVMDDLLATEEEAMSGVTEAFGRVEELLDMESEELVSRCSEYSDTLLSLKTIMDHRPVPSTTEESRLLETLRALRFEVLPVPASCILPLGRLYIQGTNFSVTGKYATSGQVRFMAAHPSGCLVGYHDNRMEVLHPNGDRYKVSSRIPARDVAVLQDGRFAALTGKNTVRVYRGGGKTLDHEVVHDLRAADFISAIATDSHENILLLVKDQKLILFYNVSSHFLRKVIIRGCCIPRDISEMSVSLDDKITFVTGDVTYMCSAESGRCESITLFSGKNSSYDLAGNRWVLSHERVDSGALRLLLKRYDVRTGFCLASSFFPFARCRSSFKPWGICTSETTFAALISPEKIAFFCLT